MGKRKRNTRGPSKAPRRSQRPKVVEKIPEKPALIKKMALGTAVAAMVVLGGVKILKSNSDKGNDVVNKYDDKEKADHILPPKLEYRQNSSYDKPMIAQDLADNEIKFIAGKVNTYCQFHMKEMNKLISQGKLNNKILGMVSRAMTKDFKQIFIDNIPNYSPGKGWKDVWKSANEFLAHEGKYLLLSHVQGKRTLNLYDIAKNNTVISNNEMIGSALLLNNPSTTHYNNLVSCTVAPIDTTVALCFEDNIKGFVTRNRWQFPEFDAKKTDEQMQSEVYESSRYHESIHVYNLRKYEEFARLRFLNGPHHMEVASVDELCALGAEMSIAKDVSTSLSFVWNKVAQYKLANEIFVKLMHAHAMAKIKTGEFVAYASRQNDERRLVVDFINQLKDTSIINEVGREMYKIGIGKLKTLIGE